MKAVSCHVRASRATSRIVEGAVPIAGARTLPRWVAAHAPPTAATTSPHPNNTAFHEMPCASNGPVTSEPSAAPNVRTTV